MLGRFKTTIFLVLMCFMSSAFAAPQPLTVDEAFKLNADSQSVTAKIAPGYFLYKDKMHVLVNNKELPVPAGVVKTDEMHGTFESYRDEVKIPLTATQKGPAHIEVMYQGCSEAGFCYPPTKKSFDITLTNAAKPESEQSYIAGLLAHHSFWVIIPAFLGMGLLLAFTPCILPMVPILSGIIVGYHRKEKNLTTSRAFLLSFSYVLGMAIVYMILGIVVSLLGGHVQAMMQNPWVISIFSALFVILALALFGAYELHLPNSWHTKIMKWDAHYKRPGYTGTFIMGCFSSLIVSPCVSAPLAGVLAYIAQTGSMLLGAVALFTLGIGMGLPLMVVGASVGKLLPKAGSWMITVQRVVGILMLGVAILMISRIIPNSVTEILWAVLFIISAYMLGAFKTSASRWDLFSKTIGIILFVAAIAFMTTHIPRGGVIATQSTEFTVVKSMQELDKQFALAKQQNKQVVLDFYADWCADCKSIDAHVFSDPYVKQNIKDFVLLRADLTNNTEFDTALLKRYQVIAPPTILFFDKQNQEMAEQRLVGETDKTKFLKHLCEIDANRSACT